MSFTYCAAVAAVVIGVAAPTLMAQPMPAGAAAASAPASTPASGRYRSAFEGYKGFSEQPVGSWRQANDLVRQIGGWQAYAREGQGEPPASATSGAAVAQPGHAGHQGSPGTGTPAALPPAASSPAPSPAPVKPAPLKAQPPSSSASRPAPAAAGSHSGHH